jgi:hypothetical protein
VRRFGTELAGTCLSALRDWCELGHSPTFRCADPPSPSVPGRRSVRVRGA